MKVSIVLVNYNSANLLRQCLRSIYEQTQEISYEIIVIDNASTDDSRQVVRSEFSGIQLVESTDNLGFSRGNNRGAGLAKGEYLLFLNTDTILLENSVKLLADFLDQYPDSGAVGPKLVFEDKCFQLSTGRLPNLLVEFVDKIVYSLARRRRKQFSPILEWWYKRTKTVGWLTGACLMVRQKAFLGIGGFDEKMFMYFEDKDLCKRLNSSGWKIVYYPRTAVIHLLAGSSGTIEKQKVNTMYRTSQLYYYCKHLGRLQAGVVRFYLWTTGNL